MNNDLPKVYQNMNVNVSNNTESCLISNRCYEKERKNVKELISKIFNSSSFVYKKVVKITLSNGNSFIATVIGKNGNYLITMDHGNILISNIIDIVL